MTIKAQGGVFGRNPTFNDVEVEGSLTVGGSAVTGTGTIASQDADNVNIDGGSIDGVSIGSNSPITSLKVNSGGANYVSTFESSDGLALVLFKDSATTGTYAVGAAGDNLVAYADNTEAYRIGSNGDLDLTFGHQGNIKLASGSGIDFSATSGTGTSELFDDYEEGTWTPVVADAASGGNEASVSNVNGYYTKVGRVVTVTIELQNIDTTGLTSGNNIFITGMPFLAGSLTGNMNYTAPVNGGGTLTSAKSVIAVVYDNTNYIRLVEANSTSVSGWLDVSEINSGATDFRFSLTYFA